MAPLCVKGARSGMDLSAALEQLASLMGSGEMDYAAEVTR